MKVFKKIFNIVSVSILFILFISSIILWITHKYVLNCLLPYAICFSVGYYIVNTEIEWGLYEVYWYFWKNHENIVCDYIYYVFDRFNNQYLFKCIYLVVNSSDIWLFVYSYYNNLYHLLYLLMVLLMMLFLVVVFLNNQC